MKYVLIAALLIVAFFWGVVSTALEAFPYRYVTGFIAVADAVNNELKIKSNAREIKWTNKVTQPSGVSVYNQNRIQPGATLYLNTQDTKARLIDMQGNLLHSWFLRFSEDWENKDQLMSLSIPEDDFFYFRDFHLEPNGDILLMLTVAGVTPWGVGLVKLDKNSNVLWQHSGYAVNDFEAAENGIIYMIENKISHDNYGLELPAPFLEDHIVQIDQNGKVIKETSIIQAFQNSDYAGFLDQFIQESSWDPLHPNSIEYVTRTSPYISWMKEGVLLLSIRNLNTFAVFDPKQDKIIHAEGLIARQQHDVDLLANGNLLWFDNQGRMNGEGFSRVLELNPTTQNVVWSYEPKQDQEGFHTRFWGSQQRLRNGNTLIVESEDGRIFEVTPSRDIVWEYFIPERTAFEDGEYTASVSHAERIPPDMIRFISDKRENVQ